MSAVISGSSSGPGGSSVAGVGTGSRSSSGSSPAGDYSNSRSDSMPSNVIYATNAHSENAPYYYGSNAKNGSMLDYINLYNQYNIANANDRYDYRFQKMLDYNTANYNKGLEWSKMMSDTAIQRQVQDLIKAGLNPVLAARLGGASYSMPSIPYVNSVANPLYNSFDSQAYNAELDYQVSNRQVDVLIENNIRDNNVKKELDRLNREIKIDMQPKDYVNMGADILRTILMTSGYFIAGKNIGKNKNNSGNSGGSPNVVIPYVEGEIVDNFPDDIKDENGVPVGEGDFVDVPQDVIADVVGVLDKYKYPLLAAAVVAYVASVVATGGATAPVGVFIP